MLLPHDSLLLHTRPPTGTALPLPCVNPFGLRWASASRQHFLYFLPLQCGQGSLCPMLSMALVLD